MSSSQQQSTNSNNNQPPNPPRQTDSNNNQPPNPPQQRPLNYQYNDYEEDPSILPFITDPNLLAQSSHINNVGYYYSDGQLYFHPNTPTEYIDDGDDIPDDIVAELNANEELMRNEQLVDNNEDETMYSDAVQNAFANYENEYSNYWNQNDPSWHSDSNDEHDDMFEQMRECMLFMSEEYSNAQMTNNARTIQLNPDAVEFRPSFSTSTDKESTVITSNISSEAKKQDEQKNF